MFSSPPLTSCCLSGLSAGQGIFMIATVGLSVDYTATGLKAVCFLYSSERIAILSMHDWIHFVNAGVPLLYVQSSQSASQQSMLHVHVPPCGRPAHACKQFLRGLT